MAENMSCSFCSMGGVCFAVAYHMKTISIFDLCLVFMFQVHLSDDHGMGILVRVLWRSAFDQLNPPTPTVQVPPRPPTPVRAFSPKLVVKGDVVLPRTSKPCEWTVAGRNKKVCFVQLINKCVTREKHIFINVKIYVTCLHQVVLCHDRETTLGTVSNLVMQLSARWLTRRYVMMVLCSKLCCDY